MNSDKYTGMDLHSETIRAAVRNQAGKLQMEVTIATEASAVLDFMGGVQGILHVAFEKVSTPPGSTICCGPAWPSWWPAIHVSYRTTRERTATTRTTGSSSELGCTCSGCPIPSAARGPRRR
jgi:hypothetical protein